MDIYVPVSACTQSELDNRTPRCSSQRPVEYKCLNEAHSLVWLQTCLRFLNHLLDGTN